MRASAPLHPPIHTHLHRPARHYRERPGATLLVAERLPDGRRSHRVLAGRPAATSHGLDLYRQVFGTSAVHPSTHSDPNGHQPTDPAERISA